MLVSESERFDLSAGQRRMWLYGELVEGIAGLLSVVVGAEVKTLWTCNNDGK